MKASWVHKVEVSSHCNFTCDYCPNPYGLEYGHGNMSMETFERVVYWAELLNPRGQPSHEPFVWLHGIGEPLLNPHIADFVRMLSGVTLVGFSTNGEILTKERIKALDHAGLAHLTISSHQPKIAREAYQRIEEECPGFTVTMQTVFNDDWAGQIPEGVEIQSGKTRFACAHIETGGVHVLHDGRIANCCVDARGYPILGSVYDREIQRIDIEPIPLCKGCRSASNMELPAASDYGFWADVAREAEGRHRKDLDNLVYTGT